MSYLAKTPGGLLPCPHCGGEAKEFTGEDAAPHRWTVECDSCGAHVGSDTRHKARAKWSRRAERTYHPERISTAYHSAIECSECKHRLDEVTIYCPYCGARLEGVGR